MRNDAANMPRGGIALKILYVLPVLVVLGVCAVIVRNNITHQKPPVRPISRKPFAIIPIAGLTASLYTQEDTLRAAGNDLFIEFRNNDGKLVDVGDVSFDLTLPMPGMVLNSMGKVFRTATPGQYRTTVNPQLGGDWTATIIFSGSNGGATNKFVTTVK
jgi:hypothetical protein